MEIGSLKSLLIDQAKKIAYNSAQIPQTATFFLKHLKELYEFKNSFSQSQQLLSLLNDTQNSIKEIKSAIEHCAKFNFNNIIWQNCFNCSNEEVKQLVNEIESSLFGTFFYQNDLISIADKTKKYLQELQKTMANEAMSNYIKASTITVLAQTITLWAIFNDLKKATNVIEESLDKFVTIEDKLKTINKMSESLLELVEKEKYDDANYELDDLRDECRITKDMIDKIEAKIDGEIVKLNIYKKCALLNTATNLAHGFYSIWTYVNYTEHLTTSVSNMAFVTIASFFALSASNAKIFCLTNKSLDEMRKQLAIVNNFADEVEQYYKIIREIRQKIRHNIINK